MRAEDSRGPRTRAKCRQQRQEDNAHEKQVRGASGGQDSMDSGSRRVRRFIATTPGPSRRAPERRPMVSTRLAGGDDGVEGHDIRGDAFDVHRF